MRRIAPLLCVLVLVCSPRADTLEEQLRARRDALQVLQKQLEDRRRQLSDLEGEEKGVLNVISLLDGNLSRTREFINELSRNEELLQTSVSRLGVEVDSLGMDIDARRKAMALRVRALYEGGETREWRRMIAVVRGERDLAGAIAAVRHMVRADADRVAELRTALAVRSEKSKRLSLRLGELHNVRTRKSQEEVRLAKDIQDQQQTLGSLRENQVVQRKALSEYEREQKVMMDLIRTLEERRKREIELAKRKGSKVKRTEIAVDPNRCRPLAQMQVLSAYGRHKHPVLGTVTMNLGVELKARGGEPVRAAAAGRVAMVTRIDGRGPSVILEHGGGFFSVYGHLDGYSVQEGQEVKLCQEIGKAGDEGSTNGPKLYFQVSEGVRTVDPIEWLGKAK